MDGEIRGLVDHQQVFILEHNWKWNLFGCDRGGRLGGHHHLEALSPPEAQRGFGHGPIDGDVASVDECFDAGAGMRTKVCSQEGVEPDTLVRGVNVVDMVFGHGDNYGTRDPGPGISGPSPIPWVWPTACVIFPVPGP